MSNTTNELAYQPIQLVTEWGYEYFYRCKKCGALVDHVGLHEQFHDSIKAVHE
jgi:hypothetical protein